MSTTPTPRYARAATLTAIAIATAAGATASAQQQPDAALLRFPDISQNHIVFSYANDLWIVDKQGGTATPLTSPPGPEAFPRFSPDGNHVAFSGNYEGNRDIYTIGLPGTADAGVADRVTYHPANERISDWAEIDGESKIIFSSNSHAGIARTQQMYTVGPTGGQPHQLPIPYGTNGDISPNGEWLAYTPSDRDFRTWNRYMGGLASDVWLFNLNTLESRQMTDWGGTDTQPMWVPGGDGSTVYYLSDRGDEHRLNVWAYDIAADEHTQLTDFSDFDVRFPGIGPGDNNEGEIVFQAGPSLYVLNLADNSVNSVEVTIPGDRPTLRKQNIDASNFIFDYTVSPEGDFTAVEARGDIWVLPADKGGPQRNLTRTSGVAERDPLWSPSGRWIAYLSDETGEYEIYVTQADGRGETRQLTDDGEHYRYLSAWSPDSKKLVFTDKTGAAYLLDIESGEYEKIFTDPWANRPSISFSHDSKWIATAMGTDNFQSAIYLYNIDEGSLHQVTSDFFSATWPTFDREGDFLYYVSTMNFSPTYSGVDSTFIYDDADRLIAVPLHSDVENPMLPEVDTITWEEEEDDEDDEATDEAEGDDAEEDADDEADADAHPLQGVWTYTVEGLQSMGMPGMPESIDSTMYINVTDDGEILGYSETMGEQEPLGDSVEWDEGASTLTVSSTEEFPGGVGQITSTSVMRFSGDTLSGTWEAEGSVMGNSMSGSGTLSGERTTTELTDEQLETIDEVNGTAEDSDEPIQIDLEGFEARGMPLPTGSGSFGNLQVNDKNQLFFQSGPSIRMYNPDKPEDGTRNVLTGAGAYQITADGKKMLAVQGGSRFTVVNASTGQNFSDMVDTSNMDVKIAPREEWAQLLRDAWRIQRDFFYVENMHGVDWEAVYDRYAAIIPHATTRRDVSVLISEMISELNVGHAYYWGGDVEGEPANNVGMLGANFQLHSMTDDEGNEHTAYRITHIAHGGDWDADARGPLSMPGVDVEVGDYILEVNGMPIDTDEDIYAAFQGLAGEVVELTISDMPWHIHDDEDNGDDANSDEDAEDAPSTRYVNVETIGSEGSLRYRDWVEQNRRFVAEQTNGEIGYIHVPNTGVQGQNELFRQFYGQRDKAALIIDERWNGGGQIPTRFIELLNRPVVAYWARRDGKDWTWPYDAHQGPKAMLINGAAGSGGDMFPWLFRNTGIGELIGMRTWGGLVGISGNPTLIDGGYTAVPTFGIYEKDGTWAVEGHGVDPDIKVVDDPALMVSEGPGDVQDPQLNAAITHLQQQLQTERYRKPARPAAPDRSGMGITEEDK